MWKEAILENANTIIAHLIGLVSYPHMMLVRETAIQCLVAMSGLPHVTIYPMRPQVLQTISKALNDLKRLVRHEAARCRQAWFDCIYKHINHLTFLLQVSGYDTI
ncbi:MMS19 nucleotide excision repair protein homolog [Magnolia sinica]|uniref:MMS19 nucleotide excision repair protein homolog n=1 Tax=Magnolia sinica TaxID=86752 RepID=UPI0026587A8D|nr:MMS19 nucleotide excision repair protein homolog [Magnolia sinica]